MEVTVGGLGHTLLESPLLRGSALQGGGSSRILGRPEAVWALSSKPAQGDRRREGTAEAEAALAAGTRVQLGFSGVRVGAMRVLSPGRAEGCGLEVQEAVPVGTSGEGQRGQLRPGPCAVLAEAPCSGCLRGVLAGGTPSAAPPRHPRLVVGKVWPPGRTAQ